MTVKTDLERLLSAYKRSGGKQWRAEQSRKIAAFVRSSGVPLHGIGKAHVIAHYKRLRAAGRTHKTIMAHYYAIRALYSALGRTYDPPRPEGKLNGW